MSRFSLRQWAMRRCPGCEKRFFARTILQTRAYPCLLGDGQTTVLSEVRGELGYRYSVTGQPSSMRLSPAALHIKLLLAAGCLPQKRHEERSRGSVARIE